MDATFVVNSLMNTSIPYAQRKQDMEDKITNGTTHYRLHYMKMFMRWESSQWWLLIFKQYVFHFAWVNERWSWYTAMAMRLLKIQWKERVNDERVIDDERQWEERRDREWDRVKHSEIRGNFKGLLLKWIHGANFIQFQTIYILYEALGN